VKENDRPAVDRAANVSASSGDSCSVTPLVVVADEHPEQADAAWLSSLLLVGTP
jgi:hypothetical protein